MRTLLITLLLAFPAMAQTRPDIRQTRAPASPPVSVVVFEGGRAIVASLGSGIVLDRTVSPPVLRAETTALQPPAELRLSRSSSGSWPVGRSCSRLAVFRNGVRQLAGEDYTLVSGSVVFRSGAGDNTDPSSADDIVIAECWQ